MTKRMLIDATHAEETRVVVLDGNRLEDFDVETATKKQLKGNIYLAKVVRVEPSLQAAFVEYGGNRHGFLAFDEIHPDYYQIPVADRQRLIEMQAEDARREEEAEDRAAEAEPREPVQPASDPRETEARTAELHAPEPPTLEPPALEPYAPEPDRTVQPEGAAPEGAAMDAAWSDPPVEAPPGADPAIVPGAAQAPGFDAAEARSGHRPAEPLGIAVERIATDSIDDEEPSVVAPSSVESADHAASGEPYDAMDGGHSADAVAAVDQHVADVDADGETEPTGEPIPEQLPPETMGGEGDGGEEARDRRIPSRFLRNYKIQEVIRRRQILLVQVVKEERGTKGAALTTYLSLAGRFCVLMPNSPRGGGISRKITSATDRRRLKDIIGELGIPSGMGLIVRTAGANRPKPEIRRDCEYLLRLWDDIREHTLKSVAPALIYEEASLIKRAIRDVYSRDIDEIQVDGETGWRAAHEFMRMLMPSHAKKVQLWRDPAVSNGAGQPLFAKYTVEAQLDGMLQPIVQLRSGGYLVINQTEALVAIDVNSGRSTRERGIEETALRTNTEAADEVARQLRLRDLAGLIVIDFIDMEAKKHNAMVERRLKEALKNDRARIQVGHISHFGLMEMSRQRLRPSLAETSFIACVHCGGTGHVRSTESAAIHVLRGIEEEGAKRRAAEIVVHASVPVALYILNHKRERMAEIEARYAMQVVCLGDDAQMASEYRIDRVKPQVTGEAAGVITQDMHQPVSPAPEATDEESEAEAQAAAEEPDVIVVEPVEVQADAVEDTGDAVAVDAVAVEAGETTGETAEEAERRHRRRRRRRRGGHREEGAVTAEAPMAGEGAGAESGEADVVAAPADEHIEGVPEHVEAVAEDESRGRRRGRRGGRRRRTDGADGEMPSHAEPGADQPDLPPVYSGPTPADPFGGRAFDIFDVMDHVEATMPAPAGVAVSEPVSNAGFAPEPAPAVVPTPAVAPEPAVMAVAAAASAEPSGAEAGELEPEPVMEPVMEPVPEHAAIALDGPERIPEPVAVGAMEAPEPLIKPIVIGDGETPAVTRKRGWWRR